MHKIRSFKVSEVVRNNDSKLKKWICKLFNIRMPKKSHIQIMIHTPCEQVIIIGDYILLNNKTEFKVIEAWAAGSRFIAVSVHDFIDFNKEQFNPEYFELYTLGHILNNLK